MIRNKLHLKHIAGILVLIIIMAACLVVVQDLEKVNSTQLAVALLGLISTALSLFAVFIVLETTKETNRIGIIPVIVMNEIIFIKDALSDDEVKLKYGLKLFSRGNGTAVNIRYSTDGINYYSGNFTSLSSDAPDTLLKIELDDQPQNRKISLTYQDIDGESYKVCFDCELKDEGFNYRVINATYDRPT